jgi:hypothetical protein
MIVNCKGLSTKWSWPNFKVISRRSLGGNEKNYEKPDSRQTVAEAENRTRDLPNTKQEC